MPLVIERIAPFALTREKNTKQVELKQYLIKGKLLQPTFKVLNEFIARNAARIMNMDEVEPSIGSDRQSAVLKFAEGRRSRARAFVLDFYKTDRLQVLRRAQPAGDAEFFGLSEKIANWFKDSQFWPKTYLFVVQFSLPEFRSERFVGILATNLVYGQLAEDERRILDQIRTGVIGKDIRKGMIFPHIILRSGKLGTEVKVKVFDNQVKPADYFYEFLHIEPPLLAQAQVENVYDELKTRKKRFALHDLVEAAKGKDYNISSARISIEIDNMQIKLPFSNLDNTVKVAGENGKYAVLVKGSKIAAWLGSRDMMVDGVIKPKTMRAIAEDLSSRS